MPLCGALRGVPWRACALLALQGCCLAGLAQSSSLACEGGLEGLLPEAFFEQFDLFQSRYHRDSLTRSREFLYTIYLPKIAGNLEQCMQRCAAPVLELMMNSVLALDSDYSLAEAKGLYELTAQLALEREADQSVQQVLDSWSRDTAHTYPFLLGLASSSCYGSALKFYVYETPANLTSPVLDCATGQWGTEVLFHRFFESSPCRTFDPSEADFFFVPIYGTCLSVKNEIADDTEAAAAIWDPLVNFLNGMPWFTRRGQRDHIFLFADGQSARIWDSYDLVRGEAIFMMVESKCPTWDEPVRRYTDVKSCSSSWKDILIPGHTDHARSRHMLLHNRPTQERDILMTFHGRHPGSHDVYANCNVRGKLMELAGRDGVDVGGFVEDYLERKGRSHFCLIPGGTSPWTNHLYESFFCGCIPVILSDEYEVAFQPWLEWPLFSIKWPEAAVDDSLYDFLRSFSHSKLAAMKAEVDRHACWFDYFSTDPDCSPYLAVIRSLEQRKLTFPKHWGRFWNSAVDEAEVDSVRRTTRFHVFGNETFML